MLHIVCLKHGSAYSADYVNILADMVRRNLPDGFPGQFECFTDDPAGLDASIIPREIPEGLEGWWGKLALLAPDAFPEGDRVVYFDLDTVIVGALDGLAAYDGPFAILRDFYRPEGLQSAVMAWRAGDMAFAWNEWLANDCPRVDGGDQAWIEKAFHSYSRKPRLLQDLFPRAFVSFKADCRPYPPRGAKVVCFHGQPKPDNCGVEWVSQIWKIDGGQGFDLEQVCNTETNRLFGNIRHAVSLSHPWVEKVKPHGGQAVIVGGGPSLLEKLPEISRRAKDGQAVFATNNTAHILRANNIPVDYHVILDARAENAEFVADPSEWTEYLISSQCDASVFDAVKDMKVTIFHPLFDGVAEIVGDDPRPVHLIGGGSTVGLKSIVLAHTLGCRAFHLYGFDSCYVGTEHHAYAQSLNDGDRALDVIVGDLTFKAAPWMVTQANEFQDLAAQLANMDCIVTVAGDGMLAHVAREMMKAAEPNAADLRAAAILSRLPDGPVVGAEIGVFAGDLSARLLSRSGLTLFMVDSWKGDGADYAVPETDWHGSLSQAQQDAYLERTKAVTEFAGDRAKVIAHSSVTAASHIENGSLDFVFIDADHSYEGCKRDLTAWFPKLKRGALLSGHDFANPDFPSWGVERAVREFAAEHGYDVDLGENFTWFIRLKELSLAA